jgi:hypothetical protein
MLSNPLVAEEIVQASRRHKLAEIEEALADARVAGAVRWAWVAVRLREGKRG